MDKALNRAILKVCSSRGNNNYRQKGDVQRVIYYVLQDNKRTNDKIWNSIGTYHKSKDGNKTVGWFKEKGCWYYFDEDGIMASDTWVDNYYVNSEGKWKGTR